MEKNEIRPMDDERIYTRKDIEDMLDRLDKLAAEEKKLMDNAK